MIMSGTSDQLDELQKRFRLLDGDRTAYYETSQYTIRQNKESIAQLKKDNKELRASLAAIQKERSGKVELGPEGNADLAEADTAVIRHQRVYDELSHAVKEKQRTLESMRQELKDLESSALNAGDEDNPLTRQIRMLENRLDKSMIKYNEAQSIRKTYETIVKRLKEERIGFDNQLQAIERTLAAKDHDYDELLLMSHDANHAKEVAMAELAKFDATVQEERKYRQKELDERRALVAAKNDMTQRQEKREKKSKNSNAAVDLDEEEGKLKAKDTTQKMEEIVHKGHLRDEEKRQADMAEAMRKIKDATGVTEADEVVAIFNAQEDTRSNLIAMSNEAEARIDALNQQLNSARTQLDEAKFQNGTGTAGTRRLVEEYESNLSTQSALCERNRAKYERLAAILIDVKAGVGHLAEKLDCIKIDAAAIQMSDGTVVDVLTQCEEKLKKLMAVPDLVAALQDPDGKGAAAGADAGADKEKETAAAKAEEGKEGDMPEYNIRIRMPNVDGDEVDEEEEEEEESEEEEDLVFDRLKIKQNSQSFVDRLGKKKKRRGPKSKK